MKTVSAILFALAYLLSVHVAPCAVIIRVVAAGGGAGVSFSDDFSTDPSTRWTWQSSNGGSATWTWISGSQNVDFSTQTSYTYTDQQTDTLNQWAYTQLETQSSTTYSGAVLRSENNASNNCYAFRILGAGNDTMLRSVQGHTGVDDIKTWSPAHVFVNGDYYGFCVTGTGTSTVFHLFMLDGTDPLWDETTTLADMKADTNAGTNWLKVDSSNWDSLSQPANVGKYTGLYQGGTGAATHDSFAAGDWTP